MGIATTLKLDSSLPLQDAVDFMNTAYEQTKALFMLYERVTDSAQKQVIAEEFYVALKINLDVEKNVLCPALQQASCDRSILSAAIMGQSVLDYLIEEILLLNKSSAVFDLKIKLLGSHFKDHIKIMRSRVLRHLSKCGDLNLYTLRLQLDAYKNRLVEQML
jgi:hypothetical protein